MYEFKIKKVPAFENIDFSDELRQIANDIFIPALKLYIDNEEDITGLRYPPLSPVTIAIKKRKRSLSLGPLVDTGKLRESFIVESIEGGAKITINVLRNAVARILQVEGVRTRYGPRFFRFFGVSVEMEEQAIQFMREKIKEYVDRNNK
jgi:hypothetical protein